jgi:hypothetical protein
MTKAEDKKDSSSAQMCYIRCLSEVSSSHRWLNLPCVVNKIEDKIRIVEFTKDESYATLCEGV